MTSRSSIDPARLLEEQLAQASPELLRELLQTCINTLISADADADADADAVCGAVRHRRPGAGQPTQRLPASGLRHPRRLDRGRGAHVASGLLVDLDGE